MKCYLFIPIWVCIQTTYAQLYLDALKSIIGTLNEPPAITGMLYFIALFKTFAETGVKIRIGNEKVFEKINLYQYAIYILDVECNLTLNVLENAEHFRLFSHPNRWVIILKESNNNDKYLAELFATKSILPDSEIMVLIKNDSSQHLKINKIYKPSLNSSLITEYFGVWTKTNYKVTPTDSITAIRRKDLMGIQINTCLVITHNDTLNHLLDKRDGHIDSIAKVNYVFMLHLSNWLNVTMNYSIQSTWGYKNDIGAWSGMLGELTRKEAEIGGTPLFFTSDRIEIIDYIAMTTPTKSKFVFRQPKLSYITNVFTLPFQTRVWIASIFLVILIMLELYFILIWESHKLKLIKIESTDDLEPSLSNVSLLAISAICQQGSSVLPNTTPGRIITLFLFTSLMFLYNSYSANIVALLQSSSTSIQTLEDLLHSRLQVGVDDTVFNHFYFPNASEPTRREIYKQKVAQPGQPERYFPIEEGVRRMRQGLFAFHMETGAGYKIVGETFLEGEKCGLQEIQFLQVPDPWLAIQKNSSYKEILKIAFRKIYESGIQNREVSLLYTKKPVCTSRGSTFVEVSIIDCYPAAAILAGGFIISIIILIFEILIYRYN
nr:glutamate receptor 1-like [Onthophagus taurus]